MLSNSNTNVTFNQVLWLNDSSCKSFTEGTQIVLDGSRSYDPQSNEVALMSYWSDDDEWETIDTDDPLNIISKYDEKGLKPIDGYTYTLIQSFKTDINSETGCNEVVGTDYQIQDFNLIQNKVNPSFLAPMLDDEDSVELSFDFGLYQL